MNGSLGSSKDIPEDSCSNKDSQKEDRKHRAVYLKMGQGAGLMVATAQRLQGSFLFM